MAFEVLYFLRFSSTWVFAGKGRFQLFVHAVEFDRQVFQFIARANLDGFLQFSAADEAAASCKRRTGVTMRLAAK